MAQDLELYMPKKPAPHAGTTRMFDNDFLEFFSRIHPATIFVFWLPVMGYFLYRAFTRHEVSLLGIGGYFLIGMLAWSFAEYVLHRWVFHWKKDTAVGRRIHFLLHGVHHDFPNDKDRLVMPLPTSVPLSVIFYALFYFTMGKAPADPFFAGFVLGYLFYDGTHYYVHHFRPKGRWGKFLRRHHMTHHHADHDGGFGVSSPLWDYVFQTLPAKKPKK
jgi:sterol desaturase/sphingolipid hydroxylase (fatty acid hydroxylase superfamily)